MSIPDHLIRTKEEALRDWWTQDVDPVMRAVDAIDIGWADAAIWATARMPLWPNAKHLDLACGWGSFMAELGWRFPSISLIGLNIDFDGPHARIRPLLSQAGIMQQCELVQADARQMPFPDRTFDSVSCFLGLQDIRIGFGDCGVKAAIWEAIRVVRSQGLAVFIDTFDVGEFACQVKPSGTEVVMTEAFVPDVRWDRVTGERAIEVYAWGWVEQMRLNESEKDEAFRTIFAKMKNDLDRQLAVQGFFNPLEPLRLVALQRR